MEIIKHGKKEFTATCPRCGCVFSYTIKELCERWPMKFMKCPECEEEVYHKEFSEKVPDLNISTGGDYTFTSDNCPICGSPMFCDRSVVYTSNPPQYKQICPKCGYSRFTGITNVLTGSSLTGTPATIEVSSTSGSSVTASGSPWPLIEL